MYKVIYQDNVIIPSIVTEHPHSEEYKKNVLKAMSTLKNLKINMFIHDTLVIFPNIKLVELSKHRECKSDIILKLCDYWFPSKDNSVAINDHTCTSCGNERCSKTEKSCWKCGNKI